METTGNTDLSQLIEEVLRNSDPDGIRVRYERWNDALYITLRHHTGPSVSEPLDNGWMVRLDRQTREPFGLQLENALYQAEQHSPELLDVIMLAEQQDIEPIELKRQRAAEGYASGTEALEAYLEHFPHRLAR